MVNCPLCDAAVDVDEEELDQGDEFTCDECGAALSVTSTDPIEVGPHSDAEEEDEDEDDETEDADEEAEDEEEDEESSDWK